MAVVGHGAGAGGEVAWTFAGEGRPLRWWLLPCSKTRFFFSVWSSDAGRFADERRMVKVVWAGLIAGFGGHRPWKLLGARGVLDAAWRARGVFCDAFARGRVARVWGVVCLLSVDGAGRV